MTVDSNSETSATNAAGATGVRYQYADDTSRVSDFDKDTGSDERIEVEGVDRSSSWFANGKRTYDLHQTLDTSDLLDQRRARTKLDSSEILHQSKLNSVEMAEREQRLRHTEAEFNQRMRHADTMQAMTAGVVGEMVEAIANRTAEKVCAAIK